MIHKKSYDNPSYSPRGDISVANEDNGAPRTMEVSQTEIDIGEEQKSDASETLLSGQNIQPGLFDYPAHVHVGFQEILTEPDKVQTIKPVKKAYGLIWYYTQFGVYNFLAILLGWLLLIVWGLVFGVSQFAVVFVLQPASKVTFVFLRVFAMLTRAVVRACTDPCFQALGLSLSSIAGKFRLKVSGLTLADGQTTHL